MRPSLTIQRYILSAILPYFFSSWLLLSVVLFVQQASRFSDIFFSVNIPSSLVWQLTLALVPTVISFTCPMAALVGVIIGLTKMQADGELTAVRAAGASNLQIAVPVFLLGLVLSAFAFAVNQYGVPLAAGLVRKIAVQSAIYKLESPIEPGVFNTEVAGFTIYVRQGDIDNGTWKNIFIYNEDPKAGVVRLITSQNGRIDFTDEKSELVLDNATVTTFSQHEKHKFISEIVGELRYAVQTKRGELIQKLGSEELTPDELGLNQLSAYAQKKEGSERTEATLLWQRRLLLSVTPLMFCLFGASVALRLRRQGRGLALFIALCSLVGYYLLAFFGEQLARTGHIDPSLSAVLPILVGLVVTAVLFVTPRMDLIPADLSRVGSIFSEVFSGWRPNSGRRGVFAPFTRRLRDLDILGNLVKFYFLTLAFLAAVFLIFTAFELWKFAGSMEGGVSLLVRYLFFLLPFVYIQLSPPAAMIATLATYVLKSRQNELVTWLSAGQSVYRLLLPCLTLMLLIGGINFAIQETVLPIANQKQDQFRGLIRARGLPKNTSGKYWSANGSRIYSFEPGAEVGSDAADGHENTANASDNDSAIARPPCTRPSVSRLTIFEFQDTGGLRSVYHTPCAVWRQRAVHIAAGSRTSFQSGTQQTGMVERLNLEEDANPFLALRSKPSHLTVAEAAVQRDASESDVERRTFAVAVERKYETAFLPLIIAIFTAPFALSISRKGKAATVGLAIALWLVFMAVTSAFEQFGLSGTLDARLAIWAPAALFSLIGLFLLSRVKT